MSADWTGGAGPQRRQLQAQLPHLASVELVAAAADADGFRAAILADIASATARRSLAAPALPSHSTRPGVSVVGCSKMSVAQGDDWHPPRLSWYSAATKAMSSKKEVDIL